ncbi:hypothetical protein [Streptomyces rimosus]|uniref:hypothetical protein n=1 Tax=Streptomyces rimosus TaxID=1927 RepID=UPI00131B6E54|nr:hypothetical protein [Streptomyces rimosus]
MMLFLVPTVWGAASVVRSLAASEEVVCPGENVRDGEEHPGPMQPGDARCSVLDGSTAVATRTYDQQRAHQALERRRNAGNGAVLMMYGSAGALVAWRATRPLTGPGGR